MNFRAYSIEIYSYYSSTKWGKEEIIVEQEVTPYSDSYPQEDMKSMGTG